MIDAASLHEGKVALFDRATGQRLERWPVDARELLATGAYTTDPLELPTGNTVTVMAGAEVPVPSPDVSVPDVPVQPVPPARRPRRPRAA